MIDDWRYYSALYHMPVDLSLRWLFAAAHDTLHVTGKLADWLTFRALGHDYRLLATTSFLLWFGGFCVASVALALRVTRSRPVLRLAVLATFALPLAASPYWVTVSPLQRLEPAVAYHQMMPIVGLSLLCLICLAGSASTRSRCLLGAGVTVFFSLTYSSGALAHFLFGATLAGLSAVPRQNALRRPLFALGLVIAATGAACLALHVAFPLEAFDINPLVDSRNRQVRLTSPLEGEFWAFFLALFDRAIFSLSLGTAGRIRGLLVLGAIALPGGALALRCARGRLGETERPIAVALVALFVGVIGYAALVSYGRASFGATYFSITDNPPDPEQRASLYAHTRFFYWWITAILPFAVAALGLVLGRIPPRVGVGVALLGGIAWLSGAPRWQSWDYPARYRRDSKEVRQMIEADRQRWPGTPGQYRQAKELGATFLDRWSFEPKARLPGRR